MPTHMISIDQISRASAPISVSRGEATPSAIRHRVRDEAADCLEDVFSPRWDPYDRVDLPSGGAGCCTSSIYPWREVRPGAD